MSIGVKGLRSAVKEARRFLKAAKRLKEEGTILDYRIEVYEQGKLAAAVKRASMDLTKALPALRRAHPEEDR